MNQAPSVALVILNWNTSAYLMKFLPGMLNATYPNKKIYVIDNCSTDDSLDILKTHFPSVHILPMGENKGFASGYNFGLARIDTDYYLLINSDLEVTPGFIEPLLALLESDPRIAICQPKLLALDNKEMFEYAGAAGGWIDRLGFPFTRGRVLTTIEKDRGQYDTREPLFWASGACMCMKASVFRETGGFYDYYYMHQEDIDLCWRVQNLGYEIYSCPESIVYHMGGGTLSWENHLKTFLTFRNNYIMLSRNLPFLKAAALIPLRLLLDFFGSFYYLAQKKPGISKAMLKAELAYFHWLLFYPDKKNSQPKGMSRHHGVYKGTILIPYFWRNKRNFAEIVTEKQNADARTPV